MATVLFPLGVELQSNALVFLATGLQDYNCFKLKHAKENVECTHLIIQQFG